MTLAIAHRRIETDELRFSQIIRLKDYLESKRGERAFPSRRDILPEEIAFALGRIMIMDVHHDPLDFVYRLYGSDISRGDRDEVTRKSIFDQKPGPYRDSLLSCFREAVAARSAIFHEMVISDRRRSARYQRGLFPLSDDGQSINMLLSVTWWNDDLAQIWDEFLAQQ